MSLCLFYGPHSITGRRGCQMVDYAWEGWKSASFRGQSKSGSGVSPLLYSQSALCACHGVSSSTGICWCPLSLDRAGQSARKHSLRQLRLTEFSCSAGWGSKAAGRSLLLTCPPEIGPEVLIAFGSDFEAKEQLAVTAYPVGILCPRSSPLTNPKLVPWETCRHSQDSIKASFSSILTTSKKTVCPLQLN